ncbi:50S ribosomal protein L25 [Paenibacillus sp. J2TS4]|uniref:50S ribosomal protein L25 n=1 Tax=Paenibacillus sp. J2TS4 TaxID=2807194 RepID=UPI001B10E805|nr:50S ribosomal protein L25 [Paenibacillus sp. J2TS4]GIP33201.1 50S ribosomal protein L25 [Paenibacillus sp. J2TS4]
MSLQLQAANRSHLTRSGLKQLRKEGRLPGVVFGKQTENRMIHISTREFQRWAKSGASQVIQLSIDGAKTVPVLLEGLQSHPVTGEWLHVDLLQVNMNEQVKTRISVEFKGTPKGTKVGGTMQIQGTSIEVEGLPGDLPSSIIKDIEDLDVGESILVSDLSLPEGVTVLSPADEQLVSIVPPRLEQTEESGEEAEQA